MASRFLDEFKAYKQLDTTDTSTDDIASLVLDASEAYLEKACNITIHEDTITKILNGTGTDSIYLDISPINTISSLKIDGVAYQPDDFYVLNNYLYFKDGSIFNSGIQNIEITINTGYTVDTIPSQLKLALLKLADKLYTDAIENRDGISSYDTGVKLGETYIHKELPDVVQAIIYSFKRVVI